ncbi:MAG: ABC transporter substrate-binding protein [Dongiaceae bacterium]
MKEQREHSYLGALVNKLEQDHITRREFLRTSTLLGVSATAAYGLAGAVSGEAPIASAAADDIPTGGTIRIGMPIDPVSDPATYGIGGGGPPQSNITRNVCEYLTQTGTDNLTRPHLLEGWAPSEDLKTWDLHLRQDVSWHNGRPFVADDAIWNIARALDPATGSSVIGLMQGYMMNDEGTALWDANAIEKIDDHTVRLNLRAPQLAVPEHLFHYPLHILDPEEGGAFGPGSNGTGAFELVEHAVREKAVLKARSDYWGNGPFVDTLEFIDLGEESFAQMTALTSKQVHGIWQIDVTQLTALEQIPHVQLYQVATAQTAVARMKSVAPFDDARVRKAMRLAIDTRQMLQVGYAGLGAPGEHHHVSPIHPEYAELPFMERDVEAARQLLAEAGHPDGIDIEINCANDPQWEQITVQAMAQQWADAGIRCKINVMPTSAYWDVWDQVPFGFTSWTHRPLGVMVLALAYRSNVPWNESGYSNPEFDRLLTEAEATVDVEARRAVMVQLETIMQEEGPIVQPLWRAALTAWDKRVKGFSQHPTNYIFGNELGIAPGE